MLVSSIFLICGGIFQSLVAIRSPWEEDDFIRLIWAELSKTVAEVHHYLSNRELTEFSEYSAGRQPRVLHQKKLKKYLIQALKIRGFYQFSLKLFSISLH